MGYKDFVLIVLAASSPIPYTTSLHFLTQIISEKTNLFQIWYVNYFIYYFFYLQETGKKADLLFI